MTVMTPMIRVGDYVRPKWDKVIQDKVRLNNTDYLYRFFHPGHYQSLSRLNQVKELRSYSILKVWSVSQDPNYEVLIGVTEHAFKDLSKGKVSEPSAFDGIEYLSFCDVEVVPPEDCPSW